MRSTLLLSLMLSLACRPEIGMPRAESEDAPQPPPEPPAQVRSEPAEPPPAEDCKVSADPEAVAQAYAHGVAKLEESREGEHHRTEPFEAAIASLREAAEGGHLQAQSLYGRTLFGTRISNQAPTAEEREDYVSAVAFLRIAAAAGDAEAEGFLPGISAVLEAPLEMPLSALPKDWVEEAFRRADTWIDCNAE